MDTVGKLIAGLAAVVLVVVLLLVATIIPLTVSEGTSTASGNASSSSVAQAALALVPHISGPDANEYDLHDPFMLPIIAYWKTLCQGTDGSLCSVASPGDLQCVYFVAAAQWLAGNPLPAIYNAQDFWPAYAHRAGWQEIAVPHAPSIGDLIIWQGGLHQGIEDGHIAVVIGYQPPHGSTNGSVTFAQANAVGTIATLTVYPDGSVQSWGAFTFEGQRYGEESVLGYLHATSAPHSPVSVLPPDLSFSTPYVLEAWNDAEDAGLSPEVFVRQIDQESGFQPNAVSKAGAIGIAQFLPATAATLGFDPRDPDVSLRMASLVMMQKWDQYHSYSLALAAYNAGDGAVQAAQTSCGSAWLSCMPQETQQYVAAILAS